MEPRIKAHGCGRNAPDGTQRCQERSGPDGARSMPARRRTARRSGHRADVVKEKTSELRSRREVRAILETQHEDPKRSGNRERIQTRFQRPDGTGRRSRRGALPVSVRKKGGGRVFSAGGGDHRRATPVSLVGGLKPKTILTRRL